MGLPTAGQRLFLVAWTALIVWLSLCTRIVMRCCVGWRLCVRRNGLWWRRRLFCVSGCLLSTEGVDQGVAIWEHRALQGNQPFITQAAQHPTDTDVIPERQLHAQHLIVDARIALALLAGSIVRHRQQYGFFQANGGGQGCR